MSKTSAAVASFSNLSADTQAHVIREIRTKAHWDKHNAIIRMKLASAAEALIREGRSNSQSLATGLLQYCEEMIESA